MPHFFSIAKREASDTPYLKVKLLDNSEQQLQIIQQLIETSPAVHKCNITQNKQADLTIYIKDLYTTDEASDEVKRLLDAYFGKGILCNDTLDKTKVVANGLSLHTKPLDLYRKAIHGFQMQQDYRHAMDDLRLSLELLLREILSNDKSLDNQEKALNSYLGRGGISSEIIAGITEEMRSLCRYFNEHEKHKDDIKIDDIDCVVHWVSNIMHVVMSVIPTK